jgi:NB-ARC domain
LPRSPLTTSQSGPQRSIFHFAPNPHFAGRGRDLLELYLAVIGNLNKIGVRSAGSVGMGGVGKTQLAVEFACRFAFAFEGVYWIQSTDPAQWVTRFVALAGELPLELDGTPSPTTEAGWINALHTYCAEHPQVLIVMDDVDEPARPNDDRSLLGLALLNLGCNLLFTTRRHFNLPGVAKHPVDILAEDAAYHLITSRYEPADRGEAEDATSICRALGYLPLALVLAASYLGRYRNYSFASYRAKLAVWGPKTRLGRDSALSGEVRA